MTSPFCLVADAPLCEDGEQYLLECCSTWLSMWEAHEEEQPQLWADAPVLQHVTRTLRGILALLDPVPFPCNATVDDIQFVIPLEKRKQG